MASENMEAINDLSTRIWRLKERALRLREAGKEEELEPLKEELRGLVMAKEALIKREIREMS